MAQHPTGTVTFLFTDIEGSTKMARQFPDVWPAVQARHHTLLLGAITTHQGYFFRTIGDEFNTAFQTALDALEAALAARLAVASLRTSAGAASIGSAWEKGRSFAVEEAVAYALEQPKDE
ncbi:MAG: adenylate/guanylate cyclase domain-containing protein [Omnitrophica WOR_2 bacterium]